MPILRRLRRVRSSSLREERGAPSSRTSPSSGRSNPPSRCRRVDFPDPDGPMIDMKRPAGIGGPEPGPAGHLRHSDRSGVTLYVQVRDLRASLARAAELGGTVVADPFDVPGGPTLAGIKDPEGNPVMLVQQ